MDRFELMVQQFNIQYVELIAQLRGVVSMQENYDEQVQFELLHAAHKRWRNMKDKDPNTYDMIESMYNATEGDHEKIMNFDTKLFEAETDLFDRMFAGEGMNSKFIYELMSDGTDVFVNPDEKGDDRPEAVDERERFWITLKGLYKIALLFHTYRSEPEIQEVIQSLFSKPNVDYQNSTNVMKLIQAEMKNAHSPLRQIMKRFMKPSKKNTEKFQKLITKLMLLLDTFQNHSTSGAGHAPPVVSEQEMKDIEQAFWTVAQEKGISDLTAKQTQQVWESFLRPQPSVWAEMMENGFFTEDQLEDLKQWCLESESMRKAQLSLQPTPANIQSTIKKMWDLMEKANTNENHDPSAEMEKVLRDSSLPIDFQSLHQIQEDFEAEQEEENGDKDGDENVSSDSDHDSEQDSASEADE